MHVMYVNGKLCVCVYIYVCVCVYQDARYICEGNTMYIYKCIKMYGIYVKEKKYVLCVHVCMYVYLYLFVVLCVYCFSLL